MPTTCPKNGGKGGSVEIYEMDIMRVCVCARAGDEKNAKKSDEYYMNGTRSVGMCVRACVCERRRTASIGKRGEGTTMAVRG